MASLLNETQSDDEEAIEVTERIEGVFNVVDRLENDPMKYLSNLTHEQIGMYIPGNDENFNGFDLVNARSSVAIVKIPVYQDGSLLISHSIYNRVKNKIDVMLDRWNQEVVEGSLSCTEVYIRPNNFGTTSYYFQNKGNPTQLELNLKRCMRYADPLPFNTVHLTCPSSDSYYTNSYSRSGRARYPIVFAGLHNSPEEPRNVCPTLRLSGYYAPGPNYVYPFLHSKMNSVHYFYGIRDNVTFVVHYLCKPK